MLMAVAMKVVRDVLLVLIVFSVSGASRPEAGRAAHSSHHDAVGSTAQLPHNIPDFCRGSADTVGAGQTMTISGKVQKGCIRVESGGTLVLRSNTTLLADMIFGLPGSRLEGGTPSAPLDNVQIIGRNGPLDTANDPEQFGRGLVWFGSVRLHGVPKTAFVRLAEEPRAGRGQLSATTTGWRPGDRLVLPGTSQPEPEGPKFQPQVETPQVILASKDVVTIQPALHFDHLGARDMDGVVRFLPHVGNLTRSIRIRSENPSGTRWHVIFVDRADVDIRYVSFVNLGRTTTEPLSGSNQIGRYSLHIHHVFGPTSPQSNGRQFTLIGNVVENGSKWGITVHNSHYGLIQDNVVYNTGGAGIMTEDGSETGNIFDHNFVVAPTGPDSDKSDVFLGRESSGLWFRGPHNIVRNNVVANSLSNTVVYVNASAAAGVGGSVVVPQFQGANPAENGTPVDNATVPLGEFSGNEMYSSMYGAIFWDVMASCCLYTWEGPTTTIKNTTLWNIGRYGAFPYGTNRMVFEDWTQLNDPSILRNPFEVGSGFYFGDYLTRFITLRRANIQGLRFGVWTPIKAGDVRDIYGSQPGVMRIEDSVLRNHTNVRTVTPYGVTGGGEMLPPRRVELDRVLFGNLPNYNGSEPQSNIRPEFTPQFGTAVNTIVSSRIVVTNYNRVSGDNFEVFQEEQAPGFVVPQTGSEDGLIGSPVAGLTNQQTVSQFGIAISGAITPCSTTRPGIMGFACPIRAPSPAPASVPAAVSRNLASSWPVSWPDAGLAAIVALVAGLSALLLVSRTTQQKQLRQI
jgi:parallel beta-helix repeat protein